MKVFIPLELFKTLSPHLLNWMQQYFSATSQGKSYFIVKLLPWHNQNNNNKKKPSGEKKNPEARNYCLCKDSVSGCAIPF